MSSLSVSGNSKEKTLVLVKEVYNQLEKGVHAQEIVRNLKKRLGLNERTIHAYLTEAYKIIDKEAIKEVRTVINIHASRYEEIYQQCRYPTLEENFDEEGNPVPVTKTKILGLLNEAMNALYDKERVLGFHKKTFNLQLNNNTKVEKKSIIDKYNLSKLSLQEKIELKNLLEKSKEDYVEVVIKNTEVKVIETKKEEVDKYFVPDVISHIQVEVQQPEHEEEVFNQVIDLVPRDAQRKSVTDVGQNMRELIRKQAAEILKRRNTN
jgi:hypothetical protein